MSALRNRIVYLPKLSKGITNEYVYNMVNILQDEYFVAGDLIAFASLIQLFRTKAVFLNWVDSCLDVKMKFQLLLHQVCGAKIVWVFHNKYPHGKTVDSQVLDNMKWLAENSNIIMLHSKDSKRYIPGGEQNKKKAVFVPHILYHSDASSLNIETLKQKYGISSDDFVFIMFGRIMPFKKFEEGIKAFKNLQLEHAKLLVAGKSYDRSYAKRIRDLCVGCDNIILDLQFLSDAKLDAIIDISDVVIMPYESGSYMNSGVMIQSFSRGRTVITPDICMARDIAPYKFIYMYRKNLDKAMLKAYKNGKDINKDMGEKARDYVNRNNSREAVKKRLYEMIK